MPKRCPRCAGELVAEFYGPCDRCRAELRSGETVARPTPPPAEPEPVRRVTVSGVEAERRHWRHRRRPAVFVGGHGLCTGTDGRTMKVPPVERDAAGFLAGVAAYRMVYLCHENAAELVRGMFAAELAGWERQAMHEDDRYPTVTMARDGETVRVACAETWTMGPADPVTAAEAWRWLGGQLHDRAGGEMLATPSTTGRDLMARTMPVDVKLPVLSDEVAELVRATSTQHRMELTRPAGTEVSGLVELDARLAFLAVVRELPVGEPVWADGAPARWEPYREGRYRCSWTVPAGWDHVGLLPHLTADGWRWERRPGHRAAGWLDVSELRLARHYGWHVDVHEHLLWPAKLGCDPLRQWHAHLTAVHELATTGTGTGLTTEAARLAGRMCRAIVVQAIGALRGKGQVITRTVPIGQAAELAPADAWPEGDSVVWRERVAPAWPEWSRPEWWAAITARTRTRLLDAPGPAHGRRVGALALPATEVIGFRGDAIYTTADPGWPDDGRPGRYRVKAAGAPFTMPATLAEMDRIRARPAPPAASSVAAARAALAGGR